MSLKARLGRSTIDLENAEKFEIHSHISFHSAEALIQSNLTISASSMRVGTQNTKNQERNLVKVGRDVF